MGLADEAFSSQKQFIQPLLH